MSMLNFCILTHRYMGYIEVMVDATSGGIYFEDGMPQVMGLPIMMGGNGTGNEVKQNKVMMVCPNDIFFMIVCPSHLCLSHQVRSHLRML